mgnify:CR=1 FL=1|jgi:hypothetical protein
MELAQTSDWMLTVTVENTEGFDENDEEYDDRDDFRVFKLYDFVTGTSFEINRFQMEEIIGLLQTGLGISNQLDNNHIKRNIRKPL